MAENKIVGYKNIFGFVLPDWVDESLIRMVVMFLLSAAVMLFVLIFVIWPKFGDVKSLKASLATKQTQLDSLKTSKAGFDKLNEQVPETSQNLILQAIPQVYSPENAVFLLRKIGEEVPGLMILSYSLPSGTLFESDKPAEKGGGSDKSMVSFLSYPIKLSVSAPVGSLLSFINKVETSLPFGVVSDVGVQEITKLAKSTTVDKSVKMDLEVKYYQAVLRQVDISKIKPFTESELALVGELSRYMVLGTGSGTDAVSPVVNTTGSLFGF